MSARGFATSPMRLLLLALPTLLAALQLPPSLIDELFLILLLLALVCYRQKPEFLLTFCCIAVLLLRTCQTVLDWHGHLWGTGCEQNGIELSGELLSSPKLLELRGRRVWKMLIRVESLAPALCGEPQRIRLYVDQQILKQTFSHHELQKGDNVAAIVRLRNPRGLANPVSSQGVHYWFTRGIHATGTARQILDVERARAWNLSARAEQLRRVLGEAISEQLMFSQSRGPILALALGDSRYLNPDDWEQLRLFGLTHLFVISGLHLGSVAVASWTLASVLLRIGMLFRRESLRPRTARTITVLLVLFASGVYALLSGWSLPVQRAYLMLTLALTPTLIGRRCDVSRAWAGSALVVLAANPVVLLTASFWMSFGAVGLILWFLLWPHSSFQLRTFVGLQAYLLVGLLPMSYFWFGSGASAGALINFVAVPVISMLVVPLLLMALFLTSTPLVLKIVLCIPELIVLSVWSAMGFWAPSINALSADLFEPGLWSLLIATLMVLLVRLPLGNRKLIGLLTAGGLSLAAPERILDTESRVTVFDVGQGTAVLVEHRHAAVLIDTAGQSAIGDAVLERVLDPYLRRHPRQNVDLMVISHGDLDHRGGEEYVLNALNVERVWRGEPRGERLGDGSRDSWREWSKELWRDRWRDRWREGRREPGREAHPARRMEATFPAAGTAREYPIEGRQLCRPGARLQINDGLSIRSLSGSVDSNNRNNRSCVLMLEIDGVRFLFPGDIDSRRERQLSAYWRDGLRTDVLMASHHGANSSNSTLWLKMTDPRWIVASAGYANSFGHPGEGFVQRANLRGLKVLSTAQSGAIVFRVDTDGDIQCRVTRHNRQPVWVWEKRTRDC
ncbi:MAG: DNA internalization-related competence protein ComEC/Rec2 [Pseudomonadota bacterium]